MPTLSIEQVARVALNSGWSGEAAAIATAIAMAESGGRTDARGDTTITTGTWGPSIGLWQIRSLNAQRGSGGQRDELANTDPNVNGRHAFQISNSGSNWRPWSVYSSGAYRAHLGRARIAVGAPAADVPGGGADASAGGASGGVNLLTDPGTWSRVGLFLLGGVLALVALYRMTGVGDVVIKSAKTAVKMRTGVSV